MQSSLSADRYEKISIPAITKSNTFSISNTGSLVVANENGEITYREINKNEQHACKITLKNNELDGFTRDGKYLTSANEFWPVQDLLNCKHITSRSIKVSLHDTFLSGFLDIKDNGKKFIYLALKKITPGQPKLYRIIFGNINSKKYFSYNPIGGISEDIYAEISESSPIATISYYSKNIIELNLLTGKYKHISKIPSLRIYYTTAEESSPPHKLKSYISHNNIKIPIDIPPQTQHIVSISENGCFVAAKNLENQEIEIYQNKNCQSKEK